MRSVFASSKRTCAEKEEDGRERYDEDDRDYHDRDLDWRAGFDRGALVTCAHNSGGARNPLRSSAFDITE